MLLATFLMALSLFGFSLATSEAQNALSSCEPVTKTVTVSFCQSETVFGSAVDSATTESFSTITSYSTLTNYVTVTFSQSSADPGSSGPGYSYISQDGTTSWIDGASPTGSFSETLTQTVEVTVFPTPSDDSEVTITQTTVLTIIPPAVTSFVPQSSSALAGIADEDTTTSKVTSYLIKSVISALTVHVSSRRSKSVASMTPSPSIHTVTGPPTSTTITVEFASTSESVCSVSYVDVTTDLTYTVFATPSAGLSSAIHNVGNSSSLAWAASAWNATLTGFKSSTVSGAGTILTDSLVSNVSVGAASQKSATAISSIVPLSADRHGQNASSTLASATGYLPFVPVSAFSRTSSTLTKIYSNTSTPMPGPTVCGEHGDFTLTWDDEPIFLPKDPVTEPSQASPVSNPYHHMYFSDGFVYAPPPSMPFLPVSPPYLVMFVANDTSNSDNYGEVSGEIGAGIRKRSSAFWFNAYSAYLGCDNHSVHQCKLQIIGLVYQEKTKSEVAAFHQTVFLTPCLLPDYCELKQIYFDLSMKSLSGLRIQASANDEPVSWFMDNLVLGWSNNTCAAGLLREGSQ
ncbi:hypothetical protein QM012_003496 [Aureobasidium pullulans]|uniref:DUF7371 domain-containing protein n=1 Tax=Aureobasidium pullulans TaxID=5580 RepID=A0ABR0T9Z4_AURPU